MKLRHNLILGVAAVAICGTAYAQEAASTSGSNNDYGDIVVTANKREQNLNKVGLTITAISGDALAERKITSLGDIAAVVPGLAFAPSNTGTPNPYAARRRLQRKFAGRLSGRLGLHRPDPARLPGAGFALRL